MAIESKEQTKLPTPVGPLPTTQSGLVTNGGTTRRESVQQHMLPMQARRPDFLSVRLLQDFACYLPQEPNPTATEAMTLIKIFNSPKMNFL